MSRRGRIDWLFVATLIVVLIVLGGLFADTCDGTQCLAMFSHTVTSGR